MKKTLFASLLVACVAGTASAAAVYSSNTVGYNKIDLPTGLIMSGAQFVNVGDGATTLPLKELIVSCDVQGMDNNTGKYSTMIMVWTGNGYDQYGWSDESNAENWFEEESYANVWVNLGTGKPAADTDVVDLTKGFWIQNRASVSSITFAGQVSNESSVVVNIPEGLSMVTPPWPEEIKVQNISQTGLQGMDNNTGKYSTMIMVWTGNGYDQYGWSDESNAENWFEEESYANVWVNLGTGKPVADTDVISTGKGFWIQNRSTAGSITFTK